MQIKLNQHYKTRNGRQAVLFEEEDTRFIGFIVGDNTDIGWDKSGRYGKDDHDFDLVDMWEES